jgi:hypothetical protein
MRLADAPKLMRPSLALGAAILVASWVFGQQAGEPEPTIQPHPEVQRHIQRALNAGDEHELREQLEVLQRQAGKDQQTLIRQLLYYSIHGRDQEGRHDVREAMALGIIGKQLEIEDTRMVMALLPYLDARDPAIRKAVRGALPAVEAPSRAVHPPSFSFYQTILESRVRKRQDLPYGLVRYMYERHPGSALLAMMRVFYSRDQQKESKAVLWAEHVVAETLWKQQHGFLEKGQSDPQAVAQLENLSKHDAWWARLYVAHVLRRHPEFRSGEIVERLKNDEHELVREALLAIEK